MRLRLVLAVVAVSLVGAVVVVGTVSTARAQSPLDEARARVADATEILEQYLEDLDETQRRGDELAGRYWQVQSGVEKLDLDIAATERQSAALGAERAVLLEQVRVIALDQYVSRNEVLSAGDHASEADRAAAETLAKLVVGTNQHAVDQLAVVDAELELARSLLEDQRARQQAALADVEDTQSALGVELERLSTLRLALDQELTELETALAALEAAEAERQAEAAEQARLAEERARAEAARAAAADLARRVPTPAPAATSVPNPQPSQPLVTAVPEPTVPNPQPSEPLVTAVPEPTVPNPQPSEPLPTPAPNPQPSTPLPAAGGIVCPLAGPFTHTDDFNSPRQVGGVHRANDLISASGTPVLAASSGTVEHRNSSVGGLSAHLRGDNGDYYFYTHLSGYENEGAGHVAAGTVIGYVGMTGNAPIPHLHFEIHKGGYGNYSNPYGPVREACF